MHFQRSPSQFRKIINAFDSWNKKLVKDPLEVHQRKLFCFGSLTKSRLLRPGKFCFSVPRVSAGHHWKTYKNCNNNRRVIESRSIRRFSYPMFLFGAPTQSWARKIFMVQKSTLLFSNRVWIKACTEANRWLYAILYGLAFMLCRVICNPVIVHRVEVSCVIIFIVSVTANHYSDVKRTGPSYWRILLLFWWLETARVVSDCMTL